MSDERERAPVAGPPPFQELVVDNFAGGGGASKGMERALGRPVDVAVNHDPEAIAVHRANHPHTRHYCQDVFTVDPVEATGGRPVGLCWFSPDCTFFSRAKGTKPVKKKIRGLAHVVVKWAATVGPRVIILENVREFESWGPVIPLLRDGTPVLDRDGTPKVVPCPLRKGKTFRLWVGKLRRLGYKVAWRTLDAADYGAPTHRHRLFLVARRDGAAIRWPEPTHGPRRSLPYRTAAECIDWSLPTPSIFLTCEEGRKLRMIRPLAENTMRRIALGLKRYVLDNPSPFIVHCNHGGPEFRGQSLDEPIATVTARHGFALTAPFLAQQNGEAPGQDARGRVVDRPIGTVTPRYGGGFPLIAPYLVRIGQQGGNGGYVATVVDPLTTITSKAEHLVVAPHLTRFFGGMVGAEADAPIPTITAIDHHGLVAAHLIQYNQEKGTETRGKPLDEPLNAVVTSNRHALVVAWLVKYFGTAIGQDARLPLGTVMSKASYGVVTARTADYLIADIGLRMLTPRELFRCQGFPDDYVLDPVVAGRRLPKSSQVSLVGNSVCPDVACAVVRANLGDSLGRTTADEAQGRLFR